MATTGGETPSGCTLRSSGGAFGLYRWEMGPSPTGPGPHFHRTISESFYILSGSIRLYDGRDWIEGLPGDFLVPLFGALHYWYPKIIGRLMSETLATWTFALFFIGWLGGPQDYVERHGHPRLRRRPGWAGTATTVPVRRSAGRPAVTCAAMASTPSGSAASSSGGKPTLMSIGAPSKVVKMPEQ